MTYCGQSLTECKALLFGVSRTDLLTGIFNRRHLDEQLRAHIATARRHDSKLGLLLLDIDHFKHVNDTFGHPVGDLVLREFVQRIQHELRRGDVAGRWGGEEFLVILPHTGLTGAAEVGERIRFFTAVTPFHAAGHAIEVTVSGGCAAGPGGMSAEHFVQRADTALYEAKLQGRDRVVAASPHLLTPDRGD